LTARRTTRLTWLGILSLLTAVPEAGQTPGLRATFRDQRHRVTLSVPHAAFSLGPEESVHPALASAFEAEWTGSLSILRSGSYTFTAPGAEIYIGAQPAGGKPVALAPGQHPIRILYRRQPGPARLRLEWKSEHFPAEPVPASAFSHAASQPGDDVERGRSLIEELGCVNCHLAGSASLQRRFGPHLIGIGSRLKPEWIYHWLADPKAHRSGASMPVMLDDGERRDVARYLASLTARSRPAPEPAAHEIDEGRELYEGVGCAACHRQEHLALSGLGSKMRLDALAAYLREPSQFEPSGRMPSMLLSSDEARQLAAFLSQSRNPVFERPWQGGDPAAGKALVRSRGCLACHALDEPNQFTATRLEQLSPDRGCLAAEPPGGVPRYRLSPAERQAMQAFLRSYREHPDISPAPVYDYYRAVQQLRCVACHELDHLGPAVAPAEAVPPLTDAGAKLRATWVDQVLAGRRRTRAWLKIRMPHYQRGQVKTLLAGMAKAAGLEPGEGPPAPVLTKAQLTRGVGLIGSNSQKGGMGCIGCHTWGRFESQGEHGPQLMDAAQRLRYDWYSRWMLNPARILSGTSMPNYFTSLDRPQAEEVIRTLWGALAMGEIMPLPDGLDTGGAAYAIEERPAPGQEAVVVRWDMPEATPAAIAVGLPGDLSYCFDAGESRLRYAWRGGFLDLSGTLLRKVDENRLTPTARLIGEIFYRSEEFPIRVGSPDRIPQRRFRGYRLVGGYPEFHYEVDGLPIHERIVPAKAGGGLTREFTAARVDQAMWFVGPEGKIEVPRGRDVRFEVTIRNSP
jgi:mono/diheme cytochrome c family protein